MHFGSHKGTVLPVLAAEMALMYMFMTPKQALSCRFWLQREHLAWPKEGI